jgi:uncharacterized protein (DUF433 family)
MAKPNNRSHPDSPEGVGGGILTERSHRMVASLNHIEVTPDVAGGKPRIAGRRITVQDIVIWHDRLGKSADEIATDYDISLSDVHAALAYYFDHRASIDSDIASGDAFVAALRECTPSKVGHKLSGLAD